MNRALILLVAFAALIQVSLSGIGRLEAPTNPDHPNQCEHNGNYHDFDTTWRDPTECTQLRCTSGSTQGTYAILISGCAPVLALPPCHVIQPGNLSLPYPECCHTIECSQID